MNYEYRDTRSSYNRDNNEDNSSNTSHEEQKINAFVRKVKIITRSVSLGIIALVVIIAAFRCIYTISEQENGVITQFGTVLRTDTAGTHFKAPWQSVDKIDITTHGTGIGYTVSEEGQNITDMDSGIMITSDFNLLNIDFYMEYRVSDPVAYKFNSEKPEEILANIAMANIRTVVSNYTVDEAMTTAKNQIQMDIRQAILNDLENENIGLTVTNITIQDSEPPTADIVAAFKSVENAKQGADTAMNNARKYESEQLPAAEAKADAIVQNAEAQKKARIAEANGQVSRFNETYAEYEKYPLVTKKRMFYEKMEELLPSLKVIITDGNTQTMLPLDSFSMSE